MGLARTGLSAETMLYGVLIFAVRSPVCGYAAVREEKALPRLCTGEVTEPEILAGAALPSVFLVWICRDEERTVWRWPHRRGVRCRAAGR
ncbi:hypothetical protein ACH4TE_19430 [Streptomyces sioyaensis]|uniref:hypothetical protein n=1 Tax=Streptomyces sioyaensis TaxID=67364 RepID=UPI0037958757